MVTKLVGNEVVALELSLSDSTMPTLYKRKRIYNKENNTYARTVG